MKKFFAFLLISPLIFLSLHCLGEPENVEIHVSSPDIIKKNVPFTITVTVKNTAEETQKLISLDVAFEYLEGIKIK
ncbi:MAG: hypothetical protein OEZ34_10075, partial [Spirochaetia bacterium]|nr:hypothetical protein [Spirochaetia bacterium]